MDEDGPQTPPEPPSMPPPPVQPVDPRGLSTQPVGSVQRPVRPASSRARTGGWVMIAGGAIAIASAFLPRETATGPGGDVAFGGLAAAGFGTLILACFAIAKGLQVVRPGMLRTRLGSPAFTGPLMLVLAGIRYGSLQSDVENLNALPGVTAVIGDGFWIGVIGASLVAIGGAMIQMAERAR